MLVMTIQAVVFDIGGVLEITPDLGVTGIWESRLGLGPGELDKRMSDVWRGGGIGTISEVFDAREPHTAGGCIAQAWSVAEVLRAWVKTAGGSADRIN